MTSLYLYTQTPDCGGMKRMTTTKTKRLQVQPRSGVPSLLCVCAYWLLCASLPAVTAGSRCPHLLCADEGRSFCKAGSSHCGPCLSPLVENREGYCVVKHKQHQHHGKKTVAELDQEIDFLRTVLREQEVTAVQPEAPEVAAVITADMLGKSLVSSSVLHDDNNKKIFLDAISSGASPRVTNASAAPPPPAPPPSRGPVTAAPPAPGTRGPERRLRPVGVPVPGHTDSLTIIIISVCVVMGTVFLMVTTFCVLRLTKGSHMTQKVSYPAFRGSPAPTVTVNGTTMGDKNLAQSAQMYHYQHHKQQMMSMGKHRLDRKTTESEITSDEEDVGGDFTVYECPGLAPTGEMEVKNPLFDDSKLQYQDNQK